MGLAQPTESLVLRPRDRVETETWNAFLEQCRGGAFQQTARWGRVKSVERYQAHLEVFAGDAGPEGGFLLLIKPTRLGRIGFIHKGPVFEQKDLAKQNAAVRRVQKVARENRLLGLVVQPPETSVLAERVLLARGLSGRRVPGVIEALVMARGAREGGSPEPIEQKHPSPVQAGD